MKRVILLMALAFGITANAQELAIKQNPLPYVNKLADRDTSTFNMVVIHATEQPNLAKSRRFAETIRYDSGTGASGHYYIDRDGTIEQYVPDHKRAAHAVGWNEHTLSIEMVNTGRWPNATHTAYQKWSEGYPKIQIDAMVALINEFKRRYPTIKYIQGHGDVDQRLIPSFNDVNAQVHRRLDPGETFPWADVIERTGLSKEMPEK